MKDKDSKLIYEAYLSEETGDERWDRMRREDPEREKEYKDKLYAPHGGEEGYRAFHARKQAEYDESRKKTWELKIAWPNKHGTTTGIGDMSWKSIEPPTGDDIREWIKAKWDKHGEIMSNDMKKSIVDPMEFDLRVLGTYGSDEDRGAVGFKKGGRPLHGG